MTDVTFTISIREDGTPVIRNLKREIAGVGDEGERAGKRAGGGIDFLTSRINGLSGALGALGLGITVGQLISMADTARNLEGRLKLVTASTAELASVQQSLFQVAQQTRASYESTVGLFASLSSATKDLGLSQTDLVRTTTTLNQLTALSGASAEASSNALFQLAQAFRGGTLRAEEFNSIIDQAPAILETMAKGMGLSMGQFRARVVDGGIAVEELLAALRKMEGETQQKFGQLPLTVGQAMTLVGNSLLKAVGDIDKATGASEFLANKIRDLATAVDFTVAHIQQRLEGLKLQRILELKQEIAGIVVQLESGAKLISTRFGEIDAAAAINALPRLNAQLKQLQAEFKDTGEAATAAGQGLEKIKTAQVSEEVKKLSEKLKEQNKDLEDQARKLGLSEQAYIAYTAQQLLATAKTEDERKVLEPLVAQYQKQALAVLAAKTAKEAATKATEQKKKAEAEEGKIAEQLLKLSTDLRKEDEERTKANLASLHSLQNETLALQEEGQILAASVGPKAQIREIEKQIALARIERTRQTDLLKAAEHKLTEEEERAIDAKAAAARANVLAKESLDDYQQSLDDALLTTGDVADAFRGLATGFLQGTRDLDTLVPDFFRGLATKAFGAFIEQKFFSLDKPLIDNVNGIMGQGGILSGIVQQGGNFLGSLFGQSATDSVDSVIESWAQTPSGQVPGSGGGSLLGTLGAGLAGNALGGGASRLLGLGKSSASRTGGNVGGAVGGISGAIGASILGLPPEVGAAIGSFFGNILGSLFGSLFEHKRTSGTIIRKGIKKYLEEIKVSFADEIDSGNYFFKETKRLADRMFGGDFLSASKQVLTEKAGPELARQLQALGTALTAESAKKEGKSIEQTGTTFGNLLIANLGIDAIPDAIAEIVQKGGITFEGLTDRLSSVFKEGAISADFYTDTIKGAVDLFYGDLPAAINVAALAMKSFSEDGVFDAEKFKKAVADTTSVFDLVAQSAVDAIRNSKSGEEAAKVFVEGLAKGLQDLALTAFLTDFVNNRLFEGIDLSDGLDSTEIETLRIRVRDAREEADQFIDVLDEVGDSTDVLVDKISNLNRAIEALAFQRIDLRLQLQADLASIGVGSPVDAARARESAIGGQFALATRGRSPIGTEPFRGLSDTDLERALDLGEQLRQATLSRYQAEAQAIQENAAAQITAIQQEYQAKRESIQATIAGLQQERQQVQQLYQERLSALQTQLQSAQEARRVAESIQGIITTAVTGATSPLSGAEQLGFLKRQAAGLTGEDLAQNLAQQLQFVDRNSVEGQTLFASIVGTLDSLRDRAAAEGNRVETLQAAIASTSAQMETALRSIDQQIQSQQTLLTQLSKDEQAAIDRVNATAKAELDTLRTDTAQRLKTLTDQQDVLLKEQIRRLEEQAATAKAQLIEQVGATEATRLLSAGDHAHTLQLAEANATLLSIDTHLADLLNKIQPAATGYEGTVRGPTLFLAGEAGPETVSIRPHAAGSGGGASGSPIMFTFAPVVQVTVEPGQEDRVQSDVDEILRIAEQRFRQKLETEWAPLLQRAARGGF